MDDAKWYVVHTYSGYENKVKANIRRQLKTEIFTIRFLKLSFHLKQ